ncbi:helix-turn-helix domain-containing protein [Paenibacillus montanisoli]|uniref:HTH cro/C1-type domain-containing protein n=1 Tax=Paenibacillus montanisoli TaxID=2081970 RepID=A0A328TW67_9BACL|nr:helix-turn-helix domain-containing protein [Paenibacillus montanisoli]RAP73783.1 hypothetical protein DL346_26380 [Paenibacillus montanisoli]
MVNLFRLGKEVSYLRKKRQLTQYSLSNQLCTQAMISRIEKGQVLPRVDILYNMSIRLKVPFITLFRALIHERDDYYDQLLYYLDSEIYNGNYSNVYNLSKAELNNKLTEDVSNYLQRYYLVSAYFIKKINFEEAISQLKTIQQTNVFYHYYMSDILTIDMANIYVDQQKYSMAHQLFKEILLENIDSVEYNVFKIKVYYDQAMAFFKDSKYSLSLESVENGIQCSLKCHYMRYMGKLHLLKAENLKKITTCSESVEMSATIADIFYGLYNYKEKNKKFLKRQK